MKAVLRGTEDTYILVLTGEPVDWRQTWLWTEGIYTGTEDIHTGTEDTYIVVLTGELVQLGADVNVKDEDGNTPRDLLQDNDFADSKVKALLRLY
jgi:hypothetical protein